MDFYQNKATFLPQNEIFLNMNQKIKQNMCSLKINPKSLHQLLVFFPF